MNRSITIAIFTLLSLTAPLHAEETTTPTWPAAMEGLAPIGERMADRLNDPKDPLLRAEMNRYLFQTLSQSYFALLYQDPKYPDFWPMFNQAFNFFFPNPDDSYYQAVVEGSGVYKISGFRGSARNVDFQIGSGMFIPYGSGPTGPTLSHFDLDHDVHLKKSGYFEVVLSAERPTGWKGDWWKLDPKGTFIWVRQIAYDWTREVDGRFAIERIDLPAIKPRDSAERINSAVKQIAQFTENWTNYALKYNESLRKRGLINKIAVDDLSGNGGLKTQRYLQGTFDFQPDEALILETEIPKHCRYWMFELTDELMASLDWVNRQITLNGYTAKLDKDGKFRAVIASKDPGVPNWLDSSDYTRGGIIGRWKECDSYPQPVITKVKLADVRKYLPADTPVISAEVRDATIRARRKAAQLRRRW